MKSMNLTKRTFLALAGLAGILGTNSVRAESTITWQSPQNITSYTDVANAANAFMGYDLNPTPETVNGVAFSSATPTGFTTNFNNYQATSSSSGRYQTLSSSLSNASYAAILAYGATILSPPGTGIYVSESGLTQGVTYQVQLFVDNSSAATTNSEIFSTTSTATSDNSGSVSYNTSSPSAVGGLGQYVIGTFTADATGTETIYIVANGGYTPLLNAAVLSTIVPEPSSIVMMGIGGIVGLGAFVRRQRSRRVVAN